MNPVEFPEANTKLMPPPGMEQTVIPLPAFTDGNQCISCWELDEEERALIALGGKIWVHVVGQTQPPMGLRIDHKFA